MLQGRGSVHYHSIQAAVEGQIPADHHGDQAGRRDAVANGAADLEVAADSFVVGRSPEYWQSLEDGVDWEEILEVGVVHDRNHEEAVVHP